MRCTYQVNTKERGLPRPSMTAVLGRQMELSLSPGVDLLSAVNLFGSGGPELHVGNPKGCDFIWVLRDE